MSIDILLATYNGEPFLVEQMESIIHGGYKEWRIIARDDGSSDGTVEILNKYASLLGDRFVLVSDDDKGLGAAGNFFRLMEWSTADYIMFCDQDDRWHSDKIDVFLQEMQRLEMEADGELPLMVCSDLRVVDDELRGVSDSLWEFQGLEPVGHANFTSLLVQPLFTGCATMVNRKLKDMAVPAPTGVIMHDWWFSLLASGFGRIAVIPRATVDYRQHGFNEVGAKRRPGVQRITKLLSLEYVRQFRADIDRAINQAKSFMLRYAGNVPAQEREALVAFTKLREMGWFERRLTLVKYGILRSGLLRNMTLLLLV